MTIKDFAFTAQQYIEATTHIQFKRTHIYELISASFGYNSFAAFNADALLADADFGTTSNLASAELIGRIIQLGYSSSIAPTIAMSFIEVLEQRQISYITMSGLLVKLTPPATLKGEEDSSDEDYEWDDDYEMVDEEGPIEDEYFNFKAAPVLLESLTQLAKANNSNANFALAAIYRCHEPNSYLYEESVKGRILNATEQAWVADYLIQKPQFELYQHHLRAAALKGNRLAALEYAETFNDDDFFALAENTSGDVDALRMAKAAEVLGFYESRQNWLLKAAHDGSRIALAELAGEKHDWALTRLGELGDIYAIHELIERALDSNPQEAWMWHHLALLLGKDFTKSTLRAYHDGGQYDGQEYDDDYGGALCVGGDDGINLKPIDEKLIQEMSQLAQTMFINIKPN